MLPETLAVFFVAVVLLALTPGPDNLYVLTQSAVRGTRHGLVIVLGLCTGLLLHTLAVAVGVAALLQSSPVAMRILQWFGIAYLCLLASEALLAAARHRPAVPRPSVAAPGGYLRGVLMNLSNPKVLLFFLAFLPQFVREEGWPTVAQILMLGGLSIAATLLVFGGIAVAASQLAARLDPDGTWNRVMQTMTGLVLLTLAGGLLINR